MAKVRSVRSAKLLSDSRAMRQNPTQAEAILWNVLRGRRLGGWKWRRQVPVGPFIVDFICEGASLVVELDGEIHSASEATAQDERRTAYLAHEGLRVIRFRNAQVEGDSAAVCRSILAACGGPQDRV